MAITITKEPTGIYPAYNDSFIEFTSDLADNYYANISIVGITLAFKIYADSDGVYLFNLKESIKVFFNESGFDDSNVFSNDYYKNIEGLYLSKGITITVYSDTTSEQTVRTYEFFKGLVQFGENISENDYKLLCYSEDGVNHSLTYFEGFPFAFDIQKVANGDSLKLYSRNTGNETEEMLATDTGAFRINVDKGEGNNWTSDNFLPLTSGLNRLEIREDGNFKTNLLLTKKENCSGVYLKWFNSKGGYSYYLFNRYYLEDISGESLGQILNNKFNNIQEAKGNHSSIGKSGAGVLTIKADYNRAEYEILKDLLLSPSVQMYTSETANVKGGFIDVFVTGSLPHINKRENNTITLGITREVITANL